MDNNPNGFKGKELGDFIERLKYANKQTKHGPLMFAALQYGENVGVYSTTPQDSVSEETEWGMSLMLIARLDDYFRGRWQTSLEETLENERAVIEQIAEADRSLGKSILSGS